MKKDYVFIKIDKDYLKEIPPLKIKEELSILGMYDLVFEDMVKCYIEDMNYEEDEKLELSKQDIKEVVHRLIYKQEYMWEVINECIRSEIDYVKGDK